MDLPLDILGGNTDDTESPLRFDPPETTLLLAPIPGDMQPDLETTLQAIADFTGLEFGVRTAPPGEIDAAWACMLEIDGLPHPLVIWCDQSGELTEAALEVTGIECTWVIGIETMLSSDDPLTSYINIVRLAGGSLEDAPALLDSASGHWIERELINATFLEDGIEPPEDVLWRVEVLADEDRPGEGLRVQTRGLDRCGRAELELHDVPEESMAAAIGFTGDLAALSLELSFPGEEGCLEIGPGLHVALVLVDDEDEPGESPSLRAMVLDHGSDGNIGYPVNVLHALMQDDVALYRTERRTLQQTSRAQATWPDFIAACCLAEEQSIECLVQVPFEQSEGEDDRREHLWLQVTAVHDMQVEARLVHAPRLVEGIEIGWTTSVSAEEVSGWLIRSGDGIILPEQHEALKHLIDPGAGEDE